jgi:IQ domain-containing protein H
MKMATLVQRRYRLYQLKKSTKLKVTKLKEESFKVWAEMQEEFKSCWPAIK